MNRLVSSGPRYMLVSGACTLFNMVLLIMLDRAGVHYAVAVLVSAAVLIPLSYTLHLVFTYRVVGGTRSFRRYAGAQIVNTPVALMLFFLVHDRASLPMTWAAPIVFGIMFLYNLTSSFWAIALRAPTRAVRKV